jgi:type IV secretory pathway VirB10-like protein
MIDDVFDDEDDKPEPVTDAESQALADERAREAKYSDPKLTKGGELPDEGLERIKPWVIKGGVGAAVVILGGLIGGSIYASKTRTKAHAAEQVVKPGKAADMPSELIGLEEAQKRQEAASKYERKDEDEGLPDSTLTAVGLMPDAGMYVDDDDPTSPAQAVERERQRLAAAGTPYGANTQRKYSREEPGDESFTEQAPPPLSVDWGTKRVGHAPSAPPAMSQPAFSPQPQIPAGIGDALAKAQQQSQGARDHGDGDDIKEAFAASHSNLDSEQVERDLGDCELVAGTPISAANIMALNTDVPAKAAIKVAVTQNVRCGGQRQYLAIPAGSEFTASANARVTYGDARIQVCADQLRRPPSVGHPNGTLLPIKGCWVAVEMDGTPGWAADVDNHWSQIIAGVALSTFLSLGTTAAAGSQEGFAPTVAQGAARQASQQMNQAGNRIVQRDLMRKPTLTRDMLKHALVIVTTNQPLEPWVPERRKVLRRW